MNNPFQRKGELVLHLAWDWLLDCGIVTEDDVYLVHEGDWTSRDIILNVERFHDGGWDGFLADNADEEVWITVGRGTVERMAYEVQKSTFGNTRTIRR